MEIYSNILIAVGFIDEDDIVIRKALQLNKNKTARINLIHVVEYAGYGYSSDLPLPQDSDFDLKLAEKAESDLKTVAEKYQILEASMFVEFGTPKHEIIRVANEHAVDLIVLGSHGRHGLQLLLGSTPNGVLHLAKCDVLAVRIPNK